MRTMVAAVVAAVVLALGVPGNAVAATLKQRAYEVARAQLGDRYQYGAEGPDSFDCSGLTWYSYKLAGKRIRRTTWGQYYYSTAHIPWRARERGDLVFFFRAGAVRHVGVYAGRGWMIHANAGSYYGRKVVRERIGGWWSDHYAVRYGEVKHG